MNHKQQQPKRKRPRHSHWKYVKAIKAIEAAMKKGSMKLLTVLLALSPVLAFGQGDWDMGTIQNEITDLKRRVTVAEEEIKTLKANWDMGLGKTACPCPEGGDCICPADNCPCEDCPEHLTSDRAIEIYAANEEEIRKIWEAGDDGRTLKDAVKIWLRQKKKPKSQTHVTWAGKPNANGRSAKLTCSDDCPPCQVTKRGLHDVSEHVAVENFANIEAAGNAGYDQLPWVRLIENGRTVKMLAGGSCTAERIKEWLSASAPAITKSAPRIAYATPTPPRGKPVVRTVQKAPAVSYATNRGPGHTHRCGRCGTSWSHENWNVGNPAAHRCPGCGNLEYGNRTEGWGAQTRAVRTRTMPQANFFQPRVMFSAGGSFCPTCPR